MKSRETSAPKFPLTLLSLRGLETLQRCIKLLQSMLSSSFLKVDVSEEPVAVLVTAVLRQGSLTEGNVKQFEFRPSDILLVFNLFEDGC